MVRNVNLHSWCEKNKTTIILFLVTAIIYSYIYALDPARPTLNVFIGYHEDKTGWESWYDQGLLYSMSSASANGSFNSTYYEVGLGYPVLGVPFTMLDSESSIFSHHRFFLSNLLILFGIVYMTFNLTYRLTKNIKISILSLVFLFFLTTYLLWIIEPWNIHVLDVGIIGIFYIFFRKPTEISNKHLVIAGLLAGWIFSARYADVLWLIPVALVFMILNPKKIKYFIPGISLIALVFLSHLVVLGNFLTLPRDYQAGIVADPLYEKTELKEFDFDAPTLAHRTYCVLIQPLHCLPEKTGDEYVDAWWYKALYNKFPLLVNGLGLLVFSPLGIYLLLRKYVGQQRWIFISFLVSFVTSITFYTAIYTFSSGWTPFFRYHIFWLPLFSIFSIYGLTFIYYKSKGRELVGES